MFNGSNLLLGIDIGNAGIKLVELSRREGRIQLDAIAMEPLSEGTFQEGYPAHPERISAAVARAVSAAGTSLKQAAVAVPTASVITRALTVPATFDEREIEAHIRREAARLIPFAPEEVYLDFQVQGISHHDAENQDIMIVVSRKENVDWRRRVLEEAGLITVLVDVEAYALENACRILAAKPTPSADNPPRLTALIDMGSVVTTLYVFQDEGLIFSREQGFGGEQLTFSIMAAYGLARPEAELAKCAGELPEDYGDTILEPFRQSTAEQIEGLTRFFSSANPYATIGTVILVGGGAMIAGLDQAVTQATGINTTIGNPFYHVSDAIDRHPLRRNAPLFGVAGGLALRSFD